MRHYRLMVIGCALSWFFAGLHMPVLHALTSHEHTPHWSVIALTLLFIVAGSVALWGLLRGSHRGVARSGSGSAVA